MIKKSNPNSMLDEIANEIEIVDRAINLFKVRLQKLKEENPKEFRVARHEADLKISELEECAKEFEICGLGEECYWLMVAIHATYAASGYSDRQLADLKSYGLVIVDDNGKLVSNHYE